MLHQPSSKEFIHPSNYSTNQSKKCRQIYSILFVVFEIRISINVNTNNTNNSIRFLFSTSFLVSEIFKHSPTHEFNFQPILQSTTTNYIKPHQLLKK